MGSGFDVLCGNLFLSQEHHDAGDEEGLAGPLTDARLHDGRTTSSSMAASNLQQHQQVHPCFLAATPAAHSYKPLCVCAFLSQRHAFVTCVLHRHKQLNLVEQP